MGPREAVGHCASVGVTFGVKAVSADWCDDVRSSRESHWLEAMAPRELALSVETQPSRSTKRIRRRCGGVGRPRAGGVAKSGIFTEKGRSRHADGVNPRLCHYSQLR
jgi:hypothetical protein